MTDHRTHSTGANPLGTRIVATLGPASADPETIRRMLAAGVDVVRLNLSHGTRSAHEQMLTNVRRLAGELDRPVAILADLCGPKVRLGPLASGEFPLAPGEVLRLQARSEPGGPAGVGINLPEVLADIHPGHRILIDDGAIRLRAESASAGEVVGRCEVGGVIRERKGVNLPDSDLGLSALTEKDRDDARWAVAAGADYLALSFVRSAADVMALRGLLDGLGADVPIVVKLETPQAVAHLDEVLAATDAVLVARGDLGVELDLAMVPRLQKEIVDATRRRGKPVIVATQMLQSMISSPVPTRAEASDVANAILDGADAVMLSGETAVGQYPVEAVEMLMRIAAETERYDQNRMTSLTVNETESGVAPAVAESIQLVASRLAAKAAAVWTRRGRLARLLSKHRLDLPVVAFTEDEAVRRRMALSYGLIPVRADRPATLPEQLALVDRVLRARGLASPGDTVVFGVGPQSVGATDSGAVTIHVVAAGP
jgi:pyruvate kinase